MSSSTMSLEQRTRQDRPMKNCTLLWTIKERDKDTLVIFTGQVDEYSCFDLLKNSLHGIVIFDLTGLRRLTSDGIWRWIDFVNSLSKVSRLIYTGCSVPFITQLNMIKKLRGNAEIHSFFAPYFCDNTGFAEERLLRPANIPDPLNPPTFPCEGGLLELDDIPERYLAFLLDNDVNFSNVTRG